MRPWQGGHALHAALNGEQAAAPDLQHLFFIAQAGGSFRTSTRLTLGFQVFFLGSPKPLILKP